MNMQTRQLIPGDIPTISHKIQKLRRQYKSLWQWMTTNSDRVDDCDDEQAQEKWREMLDLEDILPVDSLKELRRSQSL